MSLSDAVNPANLNTGSWPMSESVSVNRLQYIEVVTRSVHKRRQAPSRQCTGGGGG